MAVTYSQWDTSTASGGTFLTCSWHRGCSAVFQGSSCTSARGARKEARAEGWLVNQDGGRRIGRNRCLRLDYCPDHAAGERARRIGTN